MSMSVLTAIDLQESVCGTQRTTKSNTNLHTVAFCPIFATTTKKQKHGLFTVKIRHYCV